MAQITKTLARIARTSTVCYPKQSYHTKRIQKNPTESHREMSSMLALTRADPRTFSVKQR